jgi:hypothetical protein
MQRIHVRDPFALEVRVVTDRSDGANPLVETSPGR